MKNEKFNFKKFLKDNKDNWVYLEHYDDNLKIHNEGVLYIKDFKCLNSRLAEINGAFIQKMTFDNGTCSIGNLEYQNEKDTNFILAKINIESFDKTPIFEGLAKEIIERLLS